MNLGAKFNGVSVKKVARKHYYLVFLLAIFIIAFWIRAVPARFNELPGLDEFFFYRMSDYVLNHNLQLYEVDYMRHHPIGIPTANEFSGPIFIPVYIYLFLSAIGIQMHYFTFVLLFPPLMGALAVIGMFFLGRELYDYKAGLFSAFFLATIPAFINRTSAGIIEKEATMAPFMIFALFFLVRAFKTPAWKSGLMYGIVSGVFFAIVGMTSAIAQYFYGIAAIFALMLLVINRNTGNLVRSYLPAILVGLALPVPFVKHSVSLQSLELAPVILSLSVALLVALRYGFERYNLVKKEYLPYLAPAIIIIAGTGFLISTMFLDQSTAILNNAIAVLTLQQTGAIGYTVAENQPGSIQSAAESSSANLFASSTPTEFLRPLGPLIPYLSVWLFMIAGILLMAYRIVRRREFIFIFPILWAISGLLAVLYQIRLLFIFGPAAALIGGYSVAWLVNKLISFKGHKSSAVKTAAKYAPFYLGVFLILVVVANTASAYSYTNSIGPSICFPNPDILIDRQKCLELGPDGKVARYAEGQPWYQGLRFLADQTPPNSNVISWWDFGYWFQTRGERPSVSDGGAGYRFEIATWFTSDVSRWPEFDSFIKDKFGVDYIFMDYTLPGKYGAITAIASAGANIQGIAQFQQTNQYNQGNVTVLEFSSGNLLIWVPYANNAFVGSPQVLQTDGSRYVEVGSINEICTSEGITRIGSEPNDLGGCLAITNFGVFYLNAQVENTIFSRLMFMDAAGLPVRKVFDNQLIKIYEVSYENSTFSSL